MVVWEILSTVSRLNVFPASAAAEHFVGFHVSKPATSTTRESIEIGIPNDSIIEIISWVGWNGTAARGDISLNIWNNDRNYGHTVREINQTREKMQCVLDRSIRVKLEGNMIFYAWFNTPILADSLQTTIMYNVLRRGLG